MNVNEVSLHDSFAVVARTYNPDLFSIARCFKSVRVDGVEQYLLLRQNNSRLYIPRHIYRDHHEFFRAVIPYVHLFEFDFNFMERLVVVESPIVCVVTPSTIYVRSHMEQTALTWETIWYCKRLNDRDVFHALLGPGNTCFVAMEGKRFAAVIRQDVADAAIQFDENLWLIDDILVHTDQGVINRDELTRLSL